MRTVHFTAENAKKLRESIRNIIRLPSGIELPEGESIAPVNINKVIECLNHLSLRTDYSLQGYIFKSGEDRNGRVFAIPANSSLPLPEKSVKQLVSLVPGVVIEGAFPENALSNFMLAFIGDGTAESYFEASILSRELHEFGAFWHGCWWSTHTIIDSDPFFNPPSLDIDAFDWDISKWEIEKEKPDNWQPTLNMYEDGSCEFTFYSVSALGSRGIYKHCDHYTSDTMSAVGECECIASGGMGYIF